LIYFSFPFSLTLVAAFVVTGRIRLPGIRITWREVHRRCSTFVRGRASVHVRVRRVVTRSAAVRVVITAGRIVLNWAATRGRPVATTSAVIVIVTSRRRALAISIAVTIIPAGAVATRDTGWRSTTVVIVPSRWVGTARGSRPGTIATRHIGVSNASDALALEVALVKLLNGSSEVGGCLELDKALAVATTACFRVDDVEARLACEVFQILYPESM
jgi:hypothetical protein